MIIKNIHETEYFTAADGSEITETFGIPSTKNHEGSVAYAIVPPRVKLNTHQHTFLEWYIITKGIGRMMVNNEQRDVLPGDNVYIPSGIWHSIENLSNADPLELYCFCVPAFTLEGTTMKDGSAPTESIQRNFQE